MRDMETARNAEYVKPKVQKCSDVGIQLHLYKLITVVTNRLSSTLLVTGTSGNSKTKFDKYITNANNANLEIRDQPTQPSAIPSPAELDNFCKGKGKGRIRTPESKSAQQRKVHNNRVNSDAVDRTSLVSCRLSYRLNAITFSFNVTSSSAPPWK